MAKKTLWQRIKNFFRGNSGNSGNSGGSSKATARRASAIRQKNTGGGSTRVAVYRSLRRRDDEEEERPRYKSMASATKTVSKPSGLAHAIDAKIDKLSEKSKSAPIDPKESIRKASQEKARERLKKIGKAAESNLLNESEQKLLRDAKNERKEYHEATGHRYDVNEKGISKEEKAKRRQAVKMNSYDVEREKFETEKHPIAMSAARGAASGVTFGGSELLAQKSKARKESGAEEFYQSHKNAKAEMAGEIAGSLASFGLTAGATEKAAAKIGGRAIERGAERLASGKVIQNAAKRSVNKAVKKGLVKEGSEELIKQVGKEKAKKVASALGTDIVQNLTTGALYDVNKASAEHKVGSSDWWKELGKSAALNAAVTGGVAGVSALRGGKGLAVETARKLDLQKGLRELADSKAGASRISAPRIGESIDDRIARINAENPATRGEVRIGEADDTIDVVNPNARRNSTVEIGAADEGIDVINPNVRANGASVVVPEKTVYNNMQGGANVEAEVRNIGRAQASGEAVPSVDRAVPARSGADNSAVERIADATSDAGRRSGNGNLRISADNRAKLTESGVTDTRLSDVSNNYAAFSNALDEAKAANGHGSWVDSQSVDDLAASNAKAYLSDDGYAGVAVKEDGDICGVFKNPKSKHKGASYDLIYTARANGGTKMDCYGQALVNRYEAVGYVPVAKIPFNAEYVSDARLLKEQPDVYVLMKNTDDLDTVASRIRKPESAGGYHRSTEAELDSLPSFDDYDEALAYRDELLAQQEARISTAEANARPANESGFAEVGESMPSTDPALTAENETRAALERRVDEIAEDIPFTDDNGNPVTGERLKVNNVAEDEAASGSLPSGVKQVRSAYEYNNGEEPKLEDGILTSWNEAWKASKEYSASHATGNKKRMSKVAVSELNAMDSEAERELRQRLADNGDLDYEAIDSHELYDKIAKQMRDDPDRWIKDMIEINEGGALDFRSTPEWQARVQYIMGTIDPSADQASEIAYTEAFKLAQNISSKGGQSLNLRRNFVHLTPMGKRDAILDDFINILDASKGFRKNHPQLDALGHFDQRNYIRNILMEDDAIRDGVEKLVKANDIDDVSEAFTELMLNVNKKNPKAGFDVVQELRYLNMLGNPKTHIRNIFGSAFFSPMRQISNAVRASIEDSVVEYAKRTSGNAFDVTKHGGLSLTAAKEAWVKNPTSEAGKAALEAFNKNKAEILGSAKYETTSYKGRGKTLAGKALDSMSDFNSRLLSGEDDFFRSRAYRENYIKSYNRYLKDGKPITDKVKRKIEKEALAESQIATFNEYNSFAKWLANITRKASDANASTGARWGGRAVNAVMPFTKVPANIAKQSMNYSPIGIAKGLANIKTAAKKGDSAILNKAIDELSSGLTGTGIFGLGMLLGKTTDMFTTNAGKNDPAAKFKKDRGMQNYSVTFKDPETGQGHSFTLDWLVPASATFFSGVELANQMKSGDFNLFDIGGDWSTVMTRLAEPVMETSMLSGLHGMLETMRSGFNDDDTKSAIGILMRETAQSWINSLVPTFAGQIARTAYKTDMQIAGDTNWEYFRNQVKSKAGLANTNILGEPLGADTDVYGNVKGEKNSTADYVKSGLKNFLSPANIQKVDFSEVDNAKLAEYERRVKDGESPEDLAYLFPKKQYKKQFKLAGEEVKMSNRDLSTYNQAKTTGGEEGMRYILENIMFNRQTLNEKGKKVPADSAYTKAEKQALMNQFKGKSMREVEEWLYAQPEFKNATDAERKRAISGLWNLTKDTKAVASQRVGEQAVIKAQGGDVNEYNFKNEITEKKRDALQPYVEAGVLTYEEAVDFARNAGKTYYTENEDGGSSSTYYNKKEMIEYLIKKGYSYEKAEALFNSFKNANAKPYSGNNLSSGRGGRRGYGYRRRGGGGGRSSTPTINAKSMAAATKSVKGTSVKLTPPKPKTKVAAPKFKKYEV